LPGDVLVNSTGTGTLGRASVFRHEETHLADGHVTVVRVDQTAELPEYFFYLLQTPIYQGFIYAALVSGSTNQIELSRESFRATPTIVPPINEQARIVRFLDRETAKIDELVAKKERLIELLQEKRSALITRAVTKGLDPNVPMKDSGVEWLGEIPAHWEVKQIRNIAKSLQTGPFGSQLHSGDYTPGGIPVINPSHLRDGCIVPALDCAVDEATASRLRQHELYEGDIIFARRGEMGRCALVTKVEAGWLCGTGSLRIRPNLDLVYPAFLNTFLSTSGIREWLLLEAVGATMDNLNTTILGRLPVLVPTIDDQRAVSTFCDSEATKINALIAKVREGIEEAEGIPHGAHLRRRDGQDRRAGRNFGSERRFPGAQWCQHRVDARLQNSNAFTGLIRSFGWFAR
jgi:type I restriction enzyme, S subunit